MNKNITVLVLLVVILGAIGITYSNHFHNEFHFDDSHTIQDNAYIRDIKNIPLYFQNCQTSSSMPSHQGYRPLVTTTLAIDYALSQKFDENHNGYNVMWYHISNFTWFLIIVLLLYVVQLKVYNLTFNNPNNIYFALVGCAWYGLHTANAETVNYIISRSDILSTLAVVGSFAMYTGLPHLRKYYLYLLPAMIGMFAKETTVMFAPALIAYDYLIERQKSLGDLITGKGISQFLGSILGGLPALIICLLLAAFSIVMTNHHEPGGTSPTWYALTQPYIILHYVIEFFAPVQLTADTDIPMVTSVGDWRMYVGLFFLAGLIIIIFKASHHQRWRPVAFGLVWFLLMLLPTSSFIPLAEVTNDHRVFLPYIGFVIAIVCLVANLFYYTFAKVEFMKTAIVILLVFGFGGYAYGTYQRNIVWKTDESLWKDVTEKSPNNGRGWMNYGLTLMGKGDYQGAEKAFETALPLTPYYYILHVNLGVLNAAQSNNAKAEQYFKNALQYGQNYVEPYYYYARFLFGQQRVAEAAAYCENGLKIFPGHLASKYLIMDIYNYNQDWPNLLSAAQTTLNMYPTDSKAQMYLNIAQNPGSVPKLTANANTVDFINLSLAYYKEGKYAECIDACNKALQIDSRNATAYNNICSAYCMMGKFDSAVIACNKSIELDPNYQQAKNNLAWAKSGLQKK